jgi:hypothetical protein
MNWIFSLAGFLILNVNESPVKYLHKSSVYFSAFVGYIFIVDYCMPHYEEIRNINVEKYKSLNIII